MSDAPQHNGSRSSYGYELQNAVRNARGLNAYEKSVLYCLATYTSKRKHEVFPAMKTIADGAGCSERTAQRVIRSLEKKGVVETIGNRRGGRDESGRGVSTRRRINYARLSQMAELDRSGRATQRHPKGCQPAPGRVTGVPKRGDTVSPEPSIHQTSEQTRGEASAGASRDGCMVGASERASNDSQPDPVTEKRALLDRLRVLGDNAEKIARSELTVETIQREAVSVWSDQEARDPPAMLTARLLNLAGIERRKRTDPKTAKIVGRLEAMQRQQRRPRDAEGIANDLISTVKGLASR